MFTMSSALEFDERWSLEYMLTCGPIPRCTPPSSPTSPPSRLGLSTTPRFTSTETRHPQTCHPIQLWVEAAAPLPD